MLLEEVGQQIVPALDYLKQKGIKSLYLVGSDYVFPQTANREIKAYAAANGIEIKGEDYTPLGSTDFSTIVNKVRNAKAGAVLARPSARGSASWSRRTRFPCRNS